MRVATRFMGALRPCNGDDGQGCRIPHARCICEIEEGHLMVYVDLMNDEGEAQTLLASGSTVDDAVHRAELRAGGSWAMNDWRAA